MAMGLPAHGPRFRVERFRMGDTLGVVPVRIRNQPEAPDAARPLRQVPIHLRRIRKRNVSTQ